jgi:hypothetical protein
MGFFIAAGMQNFIKQGRRYLAATTGTVAVLSQTNGFLGGIFHGLGRCVTSE